MTKQVGTGIRLDEHWAPQRPASKPNLREGEQFVRQGAELRL